MNKRRLLKLADLLEADAKNKKGIKFDLHSWARPAEPENSFRPGAYDARPKAIPVDCQTAACAVGLACISGAFKRGGLQYAAKKSWLGGYVIEPAYGRSRGYRAVNRFFGISPDESEWLFASHSYNESRGAVAERAVARRIRGLVAGTAAPPGAE